MLCACLVLVSLFSWFNIQVVAAGLMKLEAQTIARQLQSDPASPLPHSKMLTVYREWNEIPEQLRKSFDKSPFYRGDFDDSNIKESTYRAEDGRQQYLFLMRHVMDNDEVLFLLSQHSEAEIEELTTNFFSAAIADALVVTGLIFILLFVFISWLIKRAANPIAVLSRWAQTLGTETEKKHERPMAEFDIEELNKLAAQLYCAIDRIRYFNEREKTFLKHASHELRTPIAIIQTSLDTLNIQMQDGDNRQLQRALRASANMATLTNALLWLARESKKPIARENVELVQLFSQLVDEHRYLLQDGEINIEFEEKFITIFVEKSLLQIVMANLIRNAFQHSGGGEVNFQLGHRGLSIANSLQEDDKREVSFGIGNELVKRISDKMGWKFELSFYRNCAKVILVWQ